MDETHKTCDECGSTYVARTSQMTALCPECAHILYGYPPCNHIFAENRCTLCHWDGSVSDHVRGLKQRAAK